MWFDANQNPTVHPERVPDIMPGSYTITAYCTWGFLVISFYCIILIFLFRTVPKVHLLLYICKKYNLYSTSSPGITVHIVKIKLLQ